jgi:hypothetical protein
MTINIITPLFATTKNSTPFQRNLFVLLKFLSQHQKKRTAKKNTHAQNNAIIKVEKKDQSKNIKNKKSNAIPKEISPFYSSSFLNSRKKEQQKTQHIHKNAIIPEAEQKRKEEKRKRRQYRQKGQTYQMYSAMICLSSSDKFSNSSRFDMATITATQRRKRSSRSIDRSQRNSDRERNAERETQRER